MKLADTPTEFRRLSESALSISWKSGRQHTIGSEQLRKNCPCATCREARGDTSHAAPLSPKPSLLKVVEHTRDEELRLEAIWPVGNYALGIRWGDGHDSGIYTYELLADLGEAR